MNGLLCFTHRWIIRTMLTPKSGLWNDHFNADFAFFFHVIPADTDPLS